MPHPKPGESEKDYMARCMAYPDMQNLEQSHRAAKCYGMYREAQKADEIDPLQVHRSTLVHFKAVANLETVAEERADVSTITSKSVDLEGDIMEPDGLKWQHFYDAGSPVHYAHNSLRVGKALWVKSRGDSIVAKTQYAKPPRGWNKSKPWIGDVVWDAVQKGLLPGKSITVLPEETREPSDEEASKGARRVITKGTVMEFSVCKAPVNADAMVEEIHKSLDDLVTLNEEVLECPDCQIEMAAEIERVFNLLRAGGR